MALSLLSPIPPSASLSSFTLSAFSAANNASSSSSSLSPIYSLYHQPKGTLGSSRTATSVFGGFRGSGSLRIDSMAEKRNLGLMVPRNGGGGGGELDDMDEGEIERIGDQDEDDEELIEGHPISSSSPERWDVLGLGQAMVDFSGVVDDGFLKKLDLEKGTRKLINHEERGKVLQAMDGCSYKAAAGGSLSNTLVALARLGCRSISDRPLNVAMAGSIAGDPLGSFYRTKLRRANVNFLSAPIKDGTTGTVIPPKREGLQKTPKSGMAAIALRSRLAPRLAKLGSRNPRIFSTEASPSNPSSKVPGISSGQSIFSDFPPPNQPPPPPQAEAAAAETLGKERKGLKFLSNGLFWALTAATGAVGYTSYAYTLDEVNEKTKAFRESAKKIQPAADSSGIDKYQTMLHSAAMTVPVKAIEMYLELREVIEEHVKGFTEPLSEKLLPDLHPSEHHVFTLVLDLNETLLYTDWKRDRGWRTFKRPGVDAFLEHLAKFYEIVVYSDQMDLYVYPVCEKLDPNGYIRYRLARGATKYENGKHYRDLSKLNRDPKKILYISANAFETSLQPENSVPIKPYKLETDDTALVDLIPFLEYVARNNPADIRPVLDSYERKDVAKEFLERSLEYQKRMQEQRGQRQSRLWRR